MLGKVEKSNMLMEVFLDHNKKMAALVGGEFANGTLDRYKTPFRHTEEFLTAHYNIVDIDIRRIDYAFISAYDFYLRSACKCANNTALKYLNNFGKIIRICLSNGWITVNPFANYKRKIKTIDRVCLTKNELQRMAHKDFDINRLNQVRDVFLFCCFTELAYIDIKKLKTSQIAMGLDGEQWIFIKRQKTDTKSSIPLLPNTIKLIAKYSNHPLCVYKDMPLPVPSN